MGDRYTFWKNCPNCGEKIECWYAPSCGAEEEKCPKCGKEYYIEMGFTLVEKTPERIKQHEEWLKSQEEYDDQYEEYQKQFEVEGK